MSAGKVWVMQGLLSRILGGRLRMILVISFSLVAAITVAVGAVLISRTITDYLASAADERVARDMDLARAFYDTRIDRLSRVSRRLALSRTLQERLEALDEGAAAAVAGADPVTKERSRSSAL